MVFPFDFIGVGGMKAVNELLSLFGRGLKAKEVVLWASWPSLEKKEL